MVRKAAKWVNPLLLCLSGFVAAVCAFTNAYGETSAISLQADANTWTGGYVCNITIKNNTSQNFDNWKLELSKADFTVASAWNTTVTSSGDSYILTPVSFNQSISSNGTVTIGLQGVGTYNSGFAYTLSYSINGTWYRQTDQPTSSLAPTNSIMITPTQSVEVSATPTQSAAPTPTPSTSPVSTSIPSPNGARQMENLDRGVVAVEVSNGVYVSWRVLGHEGANVTYNLYRGSTKVNSAAITAGNYLDASGRSDSTYSVTAVFNGAETAKSTAVSVWSSNYLSVPLQIPSGGTTPDGVSYTYSANDCSVGDLDGDHQYEIVVKWDPSNSKDNAQSGYTGNVVLDAYKLNGTRLWRIDLGRNIRAGAHYTQFMVYDLDGDGKAEVACKIADGTKDGQGNTFGSASADYRNSSGYVLSGNEYLGLFSGASGRLLEYVSYQPARGTVSDWGDSYGNRVDRFLACIAYLDGKRPSLVMCRGYYTRTVLVAWDYRNGSLSRRWTFDSNSAGSAYKGQGNHNLSVGDVDGDGCDEIIYGAMAVDHNGNGLHNTQKGHGDAMHLGDLNPNRSGLEVWQCHEGGSGATMRDANTGSLLFSFANSGDVSRCCAADLTADYPGEEVWASSGSPLYSCTGRNIGNAPSAKSFAIWWDGDELRELLDGTTISKYGGGTLLSASGCASINGTKASPCLQADILGDWREEAIWRTSDSSALRIYTTTNTTSRRIYTLMHDPIYRLGIAWQNTAYNQPPHTGFFLGSGMGTPPVPDLYFAP